MTLEVSFYGVRGSTPCSGSSLERYGGNTSCVVIDGPGREPIILDLGTGLRAYGVDSTHSEPFRATALVSHLHWDHVQGIPFFAPLLTEGSHMEIWGPHQEGTTLAEAMATFLRPPYFPVELDALPGTVAFREAAPGPLEVDGATVRAASVPHVGTTFGYRIEIDGVSVAYVSDHQQPGAGSMEVGDDVVELCEGVDLLIHDAQYDDFEFAMRSDWGHCTVDFAVEVAARAGAEMLALFHHDPSHTDDRIDELLDGARTTASRRGVGEVVAAHEGLTVSFERSRARQGVANRLVG